MNRSEQLSGRLREVVLDGKWVANTNLKEQLSDISHDQALIKIGTLNSIAALTFHINYYISGVLHLFDHGSLEIRDKYSFDLPALQSEKDWDDLKDELWSNTDRLAVHIASLSDKNLDDVFVDERYGNYQRNIDGIIEHCYYHFGQITLLKKLLIEKQY